MEYITGIHALNLPCSLETGGDWHIYALQWEKPTIGNTETSIFNKYGLEFNKTIPEHTGTFTVANHIRALLDLLEMGKFDIAQGMNKDFICNDEYDFEVFEKVAVLRLLPNWKQVDDFMEREYNRKWLKFKKDNNHE